jgi:hypothetical protein
MKTSQETDELRIDRTKMKVLVDFDDSDEVAYWKQTSYEDRLAQAYRLRYMAYGDKIRGRISRVLEVAELE